MPRGRTGVERPAQLPSGGMDGMRSGGERAKRLVLLTKCSSLAGMRV